MQRKDLTLNYGGLYRCCEKAFNDWLQQEPTAEVQQGDVIVCSYCEAEMIVQREKVKWKGDIK